MSTWLIMISAVLVAAVFTFIGILIGRLYEQSRTKEHQIVVKKPDYSPQGEFDRIFREMVEVEIIKEGLAEYSEMDGMKTKRFIFYTKDND